MPTPRPIIETSSGVIVLMSVSPARMKSSRNALMSAVSASAIGIAAATTGAEDDEEHDQGREQAEQLLRALLDRRELGVAVELRGDARRLDRLADGLLHRDDAFAVLLEDDPVELRLCVGDAAVVGERVLVERVADARRCRVAVRSVPVGANSRVLSSAIAPLIASRRSGVSSRSPSGAANTRFSTPPCSSANSASIRSVAFCVSEPGISNSSFRLPPTVADEHDEQDDDADPGADHAPRMRGACARPARKCARGEAFVSGAPRRVVVRPCVLVAHAGTPLVGSSFFRLFGVLELIGPGVSRRPGRRSTFVIVPQAEDLLRRGERLTVGDGARGASSPRKRAAVR